MFTEIARKFWSEWELRLMVIVSLLLQIVLVISGNLRREYIGRKLPLVAITVWLVYMSADWVATVVLSTLLTGRVILKHGLIVYWTPFLLWHLGSPHNITAYSVEDTTLWLRHFLGMVYQVLATIYIFIRYGSDLDNLSYLGAPIFIAGLYKYGERIWALRGASEKQRLNSFDPSTEGRNLIRIGLSESTINRCFEGQSNVPQLNLLREAYSSFIIFKPLFLDLPFELSVKYFDDMVYIRSKPAEEAFKLVGAELGYLYDFLFTKMPIHHNQGKLSLSLRAFCFLSAVSSLIHFSVIFDKAAHSKVDIVITYLLLLGVICLDMYSFIMHAISTWEMVWLPIPENKVEKFYAKVVVWRLRLVEAKMGIKSMAQHDLINYYVKAKTSKLKDAVRLIDTGDLLQKHWHTEWKTVDSELKQFIYYHLEEKRRKWEESHFSPEVLDKLLNGKGENVLQEIHELPVEDLELHTGDFTQRIFIWHFATELVYYDDVDSSRRDTLGSFCEIAKSLSDYMMYLVLVRPLMLPTGLSDVINKRSYTQLKRFFQSEETIKIMRKKGFSEFRKIFTSAIIGHKNDLAENNRLDVINDGSRFAQTLQSFVTENHWDHKMKWEIISKVWMEMMVHATSHCSWKEHAQQLRHGGELLTHVALLMAHLGLTTKIHRGREPDEDQPDMPPFPY